jgi:hypothetical protein
MESTDDEIERKPAKITLRCAEAFYYPRQAEIMQKRFFRILNILETFPEIGTIYKNGLRKIKLGKFRYNIYYKIKTDYISIRGIWHTSRGTEFEDEEE